MPNWPSANHNTEFDSAGAMTAPTTVANIVSVKVWHDAIKPRLFGKRSITSSAPAGVTVVMPKVKKNSGATDRGKVGGKNRW